MRPERSWRDVGEWLKKSPFYGFPEEIAAEVLKLLLCGFFCRHRAWTSPGFVDPFVSFATSSPSVKSRTFLCPRPFSYPRRQFAAHNYVLARE